VATERGIVSQVKAEVAVVRTRRSSACEGCSHRHACNLSESSDVAEVQALNPLRARIGDTVLISVDTASVLKAAFLLYILPVVFLLAGAALGDRLGSWLPVAHSHAAVVLGLVFFAAAFGFVRRKGNRMGQRAAYRPRIVKILARAQA
jgi:sigma-E factor negative regulatory protein RseC